MINLLPIDQKHELAAGRTNRVLIRYVVMLGIVASILLVIFGVMFLFLLSTKATADQRIADGNQKIASLKKSQAEVDEFTNDLKTIKEILDKKVDYSDAAYRIASILPSSTIVPSMQLSVGDIGGAYEISIKARNIEAIHQAKEAFNNSPYFTNARFDQVTRSTEDPTYPYNVSMTASPTKELFYGSSK